MSVTREFRFGFGGHAFDVDQLIDDAVRAEHVGFDVFQMLKLAAEEADTFLIASVPPMPKVDGLEPFEVVPERAATAAYLDRLRDYAGARADFLEIGTSASVTLNRTPRDRRHQVPIRDADPGRLEPSR